DIINDIYSLRIRTQDDSFRMPHTALLGVEAFAPCTFDEVMHGVALTRSEILPFRDPWGLFDSPYESERYALSCELLLNHTADSKISRIMEVGACEGAMTVSLQRTFPRARIRAVEPHPVFVRRIAERFRGDRRVQVMRRSINNTVLKA